MQTQRETMRILFPHAKKRTEIAAPLNSKFFG